MIDLVRVAQPNGYGCAIACCAMILEKTYGEMEDWFLTNGLTRERMEKGVWSGIYREALYRHGWVGHERWFNDPLRNGPGGWRWPPAPFAPVHICAADVPAGHHAFVMLEDGRVLDPFKAERTSIDHPDYRHVDNVLGLWHVAP